MLQARSIASSIVEVEGQCGGGALPDIRLPSFAVALAAPGTTGAERSRFSEKVFQQLLLCDRPILGILREGELLFDLRTIDESDIDYVAGAIEGIVAQRQACDRNPEEIDGRYHG